ncbi:MAG: TolC family protein, partial [Phycisphaerales bacterium]
MPRPHAHTTLVALGTALALASCATPAPQSGREAAPPPNRATFAASTADPGRVTDNWLATFRDRSLTTLVAEAQKNNPDLTIAAGRRDEAQARARLAGAALSPQISAGASGSAGDPGANRTASAQANLGLNISWEVDLWGRLRQGSAAAKQDALAAAADFEFARQSIAAQTVEAWFFAITAKQL